MGDAGGDLGEQIAVLWGELVGGAEGLEELRQRIQAADVDVYLV